MNLIVTLASAVIAYALVLSPAQGQSKATPLGEAKLFGDEGILNFDIAVRRGNCFISEELGVAKRRRFTLRKSRRCREHENDCGNKGKLQVRGAHL